MRRNQWLIFFVLVLMMWGLGRLYYKVTDGFTLANISSELRYDPRWEAKPLDPQAMDHVQGILSQPFHYLGKGCQSYVFESGDGKYVLKFFKYQRFRNAAWIDAFKFIPQVDRICESKKDKKQNKLDTLFSSCVLSFNELQKETGLVYLHLNKTDHLHPPLIITDKMGFTHTVDLDKMEFFLQVKADMLCDTINRLGENQSKALITNVIKMVTWEYASGLADNDHALMQNTGVLDGAPIHIDVGQFVVDASMKTPERKNQELYNKTYKFRLWLEKNHPALARHLEEELRKEIGENFASIQFIQKPHG